MEIIIDKGVNKTTFKATAKSGRIRRVSPIFYVGDDRSVYEVVTYGLFQKYKKIADADNEPEYEICKECGNVHDDSQ